MTTFVPIESIVSKIVFIRGQKVLLDRDLAELYGVKTKVRGFQITYYILCKIPVEIMLMKTHKGLVYNYIM